jgi:hypothetical protein
MIQPRMNAFVRVVSLLRFLRGLMGGLKSGGRWTVTETDGISEVRDSVQYRFPGQVVPGADGAFVESLWGGGPFEFQHLGGRITGTDAGAGWVCVRVVHNCVWSVSDFSILRDDSLVSVELVVINDLVDAVPATLQYTTDPELLITAQSPTSTAYYPVAYLSGDTVSHIVGSGASRVGSGVREYNPAVREVDET